MPFSMQGEDIMNILMTSVMCLHLNMQEEDILEHTMTSIIVYTLVNL